MSAHVEPRCWICQRTATDDNPVRYEQSMHAYECKACGEALAAAGRPVNQEASNG